jgi:hypothetical protein
VGAKFQYDRGVVVVISIWHSLTEELDCWLDTGRTATFWWRDDDAIAPTPQLELLLKHAQSVPISLAVIPASTTPELAQRLHDVHSVVVLQHGWLHSNHAAPTKSEYPRSRADSDVARELAAGRRLLADNFGQQAIPAFVPPWHAFDNRFLALLPRSGSVGISRKGPRPNLFAAEGLLQVNTHVAPVKWTVPPSFGDVDEYLAAIVDHLHGRRIGRYDSDEPTGLLTHHLVQDDRSYDFMARLGDVILRHPAAKWLDGREVFNFDAANV